MGEEVKLGLLKKPKVLLFDYWVCLEYCTTIQSVMPPVVDNKGGGYLRPNV